MSYHNRTVAIYSLEALPAATISGISHNLYIKADFRSASFSLTISEGYGRERRFNSGKRNDILKKMVNSLAAKPDKSIRQ